MGAVEDAVDAAASFIGPFVDKDRTSRATHADHSDPNELVRQALSHLQAINTADLAADPDAPYDASLAGVVYGLLDVTTSLGILPHLSPGVPFSQRPRSVLTVIFSVRPRRSQEQLSETVLNLSPILGQKSSGLQPLLNQRILPDIISALAELALSPSNLKTQDAFVPVYQKAIEEIPTSRLLPILTTFLQQPLPAWLKPVMSKELAMIPLRERGIRHLIEFLALAYLTQNSRVPQEADGPQSQIPIPIEAVTQASKLLALPPEGMHQEDWLRKIAPQLWELLDGTKGPELSWAAGQIIARGILSKRATGAPGTIGWELFAGPLQQTLDPRLRPAENNHGQVLVQEQDLSTTLGRLSAIVSSYSHAGILRRLIGPVLLPLWALLNYTQSRPAVNKKWALLSKSIMSRYMSLACDPKQVDNIAQNLFWDGNGSWAFGPGSQGGIEIRQRHADHGPTEDMDNILTRIGSLDSRVNVLVSLLADARIPDDVAGAIFLQATQRWLSPVQGSKTSLTDEVETNPLATLIDAKLTEAMVNKFKDQFARSSQHIMELMRQLLSNFVSEHKVKVEKNKSSRISLRNIVQTERQGEDVERDSAEEDLVSFATSILSTLVSSPDFKQTPETRTTLASTIAPLVYLSQAHSSHHIPPLITNSANALLQLLQPPTASTQIASTNPLADHRTTLKVILKDLTSPEPPNRTWALNTLHKLLRNPAAFPVIDVPSTAHLLLSASLVDPESYVHIAAIPVLVDLAIRAPHPTVKILVEAFIDIDEQSLKLSRGRQTDKKEQELQNALDFRLRIGEVLNNILLADQFWNETTPSHYKLVKTITSACLTLASRRAQRTNTLSTRTKIAQAEQQRQEEGEAAWGGPIPNLLDPNGEDEKDQAERDELLGIVKGWEDTGIEEDVRIRASALSVLGTVLEHRLGLMKQVSVDAAMQMVLLVLAMETGEVKGILRRAAVLVIMGLMRGLDGALERGEEARVGLSMAQQGEVERVVRWVGNEDGDALVKDHAASVLEGLETLRMKKMYRVRDKGLRLGNDLGLEGGLRGVDVRLDLEERKGGRKMVVEEVE
ncbi:hypothetical protein CC86DRAFT_10812 [Ophiobolus disseminans]|uniref:RNA polymerase II assembly factor Rtp1 C-terminal domain-containing protein n=1 Tax=Ophiobolus disseminans TaxID=1469910 RepID=A0A6A7ALR3_9PLEO|nr:hypothetical protein CC86DRAFT_10812 [Ophiobolus disseminans]